MQLCQFSASFSLQFLGRILNIFFENLPRQPIKFSYLDKSRMQHGGLLNKHICGKNQISPVRQQKLSIISFPIIKVREKQ